MTYSDLYLLAQRLLSTPDRYSEFQLLVGAIPDWLPIQIPVPENSRVLGSHVSNPNKISIIIESLLSIQEIHDFYSHTIRNLGGEEHEVEYSPLIDPTHATWRFFYPTGQRLHMTAVPLDSGSTHLRLHVLGDLSRGQGENTVPMSLASSLASDSVLAPFLELPSEITERCSSYATDSKGQLITLAMTTNMKISALIEYFHQKLVNANWRIVNQSSDSQVAWSMWTQTSNQIQIWSFLCLSIFPGNINRKFLYFRREP